MRRRRPKLVYKIAVASRHKGDSAEVAYDMAHRALERLNADDKGCRAYYDDKREVAIIEAPERLLLRSIVKDLSAFDLYVLVDAELREMGIDGEKDL